VGSKRIYTGSVVLKSFAFTNVNFKSESGNDHPEMMNGTTMMQDHEVIKTKGVASTANQMHSENLITGYMNIKDVLVESNHEGAQNAAVEMLNHVTMIDKSNISNENSNMVDKIEKNLKNIQGSNSLDEARNMFSSLSETMYEFVVNNASLSQPVYYKFCPMAMNDKGAYWLSNEKEIRNPYFGDKMMKCGEIKKEITN
jgi:membrane fusion protein, copper/silver efflux system